MNATTRIAPKQLITLIFRVEPGTLGPQGVDHVVGFCEFAQAQYVPENVSFMRWQIIPRLDKSQPELEYVIGDKKLSAAQALKYLKLFEQDLEEVEDHLIHYVSQQVNQYFGR